VTGLREDLYYGSDQSAPLQANSGTTVQAITSPKGNLIFGPWQNTEYYLSVGQGFHSNDLRGALTNVGKPGPMGGQVPHDARAITNPRKMGTVVDVTVCCAPG